MPGMRRRRASASMAGKVKDAYLVMGEYDLVAVTEVPNDGTAPDL